EMRAIAGLVVACEDRRRKRGRGPGAGNDLVSLKRECEQLRRECARQQALARATRRTVGLVQEAPPAATPAPEGKAKRRKQRPRARALRMAAILQDGNRKAPAIEEVPAMGGPGDVPTGV